MLISRVLWTASQISISLKLSNTPTHWGQLALWLVNPTDNEESCTKCSCWYTLSSPALGLITSETIGTPMWAMLDMMSLSSGGMLACWRSLHRFSSVTPDMHNDVQKHAAHTENTCIRACTCREVVSRKQITLLPQNVQPIQSYRSHKHGQVYQQKRLLCSTTVLDKNVLVGGTPTHCIHNSILLQHTCDTVQVCRELHLYCKYKHFLKVTHINEDKHCCWSMQKRKRADEERGQEMI